MEVIPMSEKDFDREIMDDSMEESDLAPDLISLIDDDGKEYEFEILDSYDCDEGHYIAIIPYTPDAEDDLENDGDLMILKAVDDEEGDGEDGDFYYSIEDDEEFNRISAIFVSRLEEFYDIVEDSGDE